MANYCKICQERYTRGYNVPKLLPCSHTYCLICIFKELTRYGEFQCKSCSEIIQTERELRCLAVDDSKLSTVQPDLHKPGSIIEEEAYRVDEFEEEFDTGFLSGRRSVGNRAKGTVKKIGDSLYQSKRGVFIEKEKYLEKKSMARQDEDFAKDRRGYFSLRKDNTERERRRKDRSLFLSVRKIVEEEPLFDSKAKDSPKKDEDDYIPWFGSSSGKRRDGKLSDFVIWHRGLDNGDDQESQASSQMNMKIEYLTCVIPDCDNDVSYNYKDKGSRFCSRLCREKWPDFPNGKPPG